jgi:rod shape-determining protein MreD
MRNSVPKTNRPPVWRLGAVLLCGVLAQGLLAPRLAPPGAAPDLLLVATAAVAAAAPSRSAAIFGFAAGLAADLFLVTPFGLSAAAFTAIARAGAAFPVPRRALLITPRVAVSGLLAGALVMFGAAAFGERPVPSSATLGLVLRASVTAAALSPPVFAVLRRLVGSGPPA